MDLFLAFDGGGTNCRAAVANRESTILGKGAAGPANTSTRADLAVENILEAAREALTNANLNGVALEKIPAFLGLAGENVTSGDSPLVRHLPFPRIHIEDDTGIALQGALGDSEGIIAIVGTGSAFIARQPDGIARVGGWGFAAGDQGSGADIGRSLFRETLLACDGIRVHSEITRDLLTEFSGNAAAISAAAQAHSPGGFARYAPRVFEAARRGDRVAGTIIDAALRHVNASLAALHWRECPKICLVGGLAKEYVRQKRLSYREIMSPPLADPLTGAVQLAVRRFASAQTDRPA